MWGGSEQIKPTVAGHDSMEETLKPLPLYFKVLETLPAIAVSNYQSNFFKGN